MSEVKEAKRTVHINDKDYSFNYPNAYRCNQLQSVLGLDIIKDVAECEKNPGLWTKELDTPEKVKRSLQIIMGDDATDEMVQTFSPFDLAQVYTLFFSEMLIPKVRFNGELKRFADISAENQANQSPQVTPSAS